MEISSGNFCGLICFCEYFCLILFTDMEHAQLHPLDCVKGNTHQGSTRFSPLSRGNQCTPITYFAVLYSSVVDVDRWSPDTVDFVLFHGDLIYQSVRHSFDYFEYNELPLSISVPNSEEILSCSFGAHLSGFMHFPNSCSDFHSFPDAVFAACQNSLGCLVTVNQTTIAVIERDGLYYVFDPHSRNHLGLVDANGTAVLLHFSSVTCIYSLMKQLHRIGENAEDCFALWPRDHDQHCQFDIVPIIRVCPGTSSVSEHVASVAVNVELAAQCSQNTDDGDQTCDSVNISCQLCRKSFTSKAALKMHQVRIHRSKSSVPDLKKSVNTNAVVLEDINEVTVKGKERCNGCGKFYAHMSNHKKCSKRLLKKAEVIITNDLAVAVPAVHVTEEVVHTPKIRRGRKPKQCPVSTEASHTPIASTSPLSPRKKGATRKARTRLSLAAELDELKTSCIKKKLDDHIKDPLLSKLRVYHNHLSLQADNILTEKLSAEVAEVVNDLSQIDDISRPFQWSKADEARLNQLNADAKKLQTPGQWTWAAKEGTDQFDYNHKRLQYFVQHELQTVVKHCDNCKSTGILVGLDQIDSAYCHDCTVDRTTNKQTNMQRCRAWDMVRPRDKEYPKRTELGHELEDLPQLYPGDKAVLAAVHPVVTVRKNYFANKKLRQESITLMQDAQQTWCKILPRTDLKDRFVVIERTSMNHARRQIVANPDSAAMWLRFLFKNHTQFIRMEKEGELKLSEEALRVLQSQSELGEVLADVEYDDDDDDDKVREESHTATSSSSGIQQAELESGFSRTDVFTFDKFPHLYLKTQDFLKIKQSGQIEIIDDRQKRVPIYNVSATLAFPYLYPRGEKSPLDFRDFKMSKYLLKKQTLFAYKMADAKYKWEYAEDDTHLMYQYARMVELMINARTTWYLQQTPDVAHLPMDEVIQAFKSGFSGDESVIDSKMPGLSSLMMKLPNSREMWFSERLGIEAVSRDFGDPNVFLTLSNDPRSTYDTRALLYRLENGAEMPPDHPYELDTERFTELMSRYAPQMAIYLCRKTKMFLKAFLCDICGISEKEPSGDWTKRDRLEEGYYWARVEFTETRGVQHWHCLAKFPHVLDTALIGRMIQNGRVVRQEMKCANIKPGEEENAWEIIEVGLLASRYATLFADSISTASFYTEDVGTDCHKPDKIVDVDKLRQQFVQDYKNKNVTMSTHPVMRRFCDDFCDENTYKEMAKVAAVSCVHNCIQTRCGGDEKTGKGCRFDFPKKNLNHTVPAVMQVNVKQMEARMLLRRTCSRVPNLNQYFLLYWRTNHDLTVLIDASHKMRYATKYAAKSGKYTELLNEIIEYLSQRSMDIIPTNMKHVLSQLLLADVSHRAFMSKQELSYRVMDLPVVRRTYTDVGVVGFYRRSYLTLSSTDDHTIVYSDRTDYSAYAERCSEKTVVVNRNNARPENMLTEDILERMNFRDFAETVNHEWHKDARVAAEEIDEDTSRKVMTRDVSSGHWVLKRRSKRRHIRFSTVLYTDAACEYEPVEADETMPQTSFFSLPVEKRKQLYRAYMELVCYVPWVGSPEESFLNDSQRAELEDALQDPEKDHRYSLKRLEMFFQVYKQKWDSSEVAPVGSRWRRDNQYSYSMYLTTQHNLDVHMRRVENEGMLKARYEADEELRETGIDLRYEIRDEVDQSEYPSVLNFLPPDTFRELLDQKPPEMAEIDIAFPTQTSWQELEEMVKVEKTKLFMAQPPVCSVAYEEMTEVQQWAVDLGIDMNQKILYLCGKAGCGKTQVALKICELLNGRVQAAAATGKAASLLGAPTVHGMFRWSHCGGDSAPSSRKLSELRAFYQDTDVFIVDEVNAMSAAMLAQMHETLTVLFNPNGQQDAEQNELPFGGKKVIFLGDASQLKPVMGEPIYGEGSCTSTKPARVRGCRGRRQTQYHLTSKGQELYRKYLSTNCVLLNRGQRNFGLLQQICDRLRNGKQTDDDRKKLLCRRRKFPSVTTDLTLHYENENCSFTNLTQLWSECSSANLARRVYICKASYHTTQDNHSVVDGLAALPQQKFSFAADVLCVAVSCDVRLIKNVNVAAGLVNSATGTVVRVIYDNADSTALIAGKHPPPYCIVVDFSGFRGFLTKTGQRSHPFPNQPHWVPVYREKFVAARADLPSWIVMKQEVKDCWRVQFPLDLCSAMTCH